MVCWQYFNSLQEFIKFIIRDQIFKNVELAGLIADDNQNQINSDSCFKLADKRHQVALLFEKWVDHLLEHLQPGFYLFLFCRFFGIFKPEIHKISLVIRILSIKKIVEDSWLYLLDFKNLIFIWRNFVVVISK